MIPDKAHNRYMSMSDLSWVHIPEMYAGLAHREFQPVEAGARR